MVPIPRTKGRLGVVWLGGRNAELNMLARSSTSFLAFCAFERLRRILAPACERKPLLTAREREVLTWAAQGKSAWEIAEILNIAKRAVDEHAQTAFKKLGAVNRTHAVAIAIREQIIAF
jgi:LuxR family quorum sensing-dependent transcriptional regulator